MSQLVKGAKSTEILVPPMLPFLTSVFGRVAGILGRGISVFPFSGMKGKKRMLGRPLVKIVQYPHKTHTGGGYITPEHPVYFSLIKKSYPKKPQVSFRFSDGHLQLIQRVERDFVRGVISLTLNLKEDGSFALERSSNPSYTLEQMDIIDRNLHLKWKGLCVFTSTDQSELQPLENIR